MPRNKKAAAAKRAKSAAQRRSRAKSERTAKPASRKSDKAKTPKTKRTRRAVTSPSANRAEGIRLFAIAGRPSKEDFLTVYGERGHLMTWAQRSAAGVPAEKFREALAAKQRKQ